MKKRIEKDLIIDFNPPTKKGVPFVKLQNRLFFWQKRLDMTEWKLNLMIVDFKKDSGFRQSGHFIANVKNKTASILLTWNPWKDEEYILLHEMIHVLLYDIDKFSENKIKSLTKNNTKILDIYFEKLENTVHHLTRVILERNIK